MLDKLLRDSDQYVKSYKMMHEVEQEEIKRLGNSLNSKREIGMISIKSPCLDKNRYNVAACNEVAVVFVSEDGDPPIERDFCIYEKTSDKTIRITIICKHEDTMVYPLIFLFGGSEQSPCIKSQNSESSSNINALQYYKYLLSARKGFSHYLNLGRTTQKFVDDQWMKINGSRLYFVRKNQQTFRTELFKSSRYFS